MTYKHKRTSVAGNIPSAAQLQAGEIAINFADKSIYTKDGGGVVIELARDIVKSSSAPATPVAGTFWYNTTNDTFNYHNGTNWVVVSSGTVTSITAGTGLSGGTITASGTIALNDTAVTIGSYGSAANTVTFTVDQQGRLTASSQQAIAIDWTQVTSGKPTTLAGYGITDGITANSQVTFANTITFSNTVTVGVLSANGTIGAAGEILKSDGTKSYWGSAGGTGTVTNIATGTGLSGGPITGTGTIALADTAVTPGTQGAANSVSTFTVDQQGRLTAAGNTSIAIDWTQVTSGKPTTLAGYGITDGVKTVNGIAPDGAGNVAVALGNVSTGLPGAYPAAVEGDIFIVSGSTTENNGKTYIYDGSTWQEISGPDMAAYDARYVNVSGDTMTGTLAVVGLSANGDIGTAGQVLKSDGTKAYWDVAGGTGTVTNIATGTGLTGGPISTSGTITLADTAVTTGSYGSANTVATFTVDQQGRLTAAGNTLVAIDWTQVTSGKPTTLAGYGITDGLTANSQVTFSNTITFSNTVTFSNNVTVGAMIANGTIGAAGEILKSDGTKSYWGTAGGTGTVTNIATGAGLTGGPITGTGTIALDTSGATAGSYGSGTAIPVVTVDQYGRITSISTSTNAPDWTNIASKPTTLAGYGITDAVVSTRTITGATSLTGGGDLSADRTIALVNDSAAPGNSFYYGTNGSGTKGYFSLPAGGTGTVTNIATGTGLSGGPISTTGTITLADTAVTTGSYGNTTNISTFTVDQQGRLTAAGTSKLDWSVITSGKPTTLAGYGITDGVTAASQVAWTNTHSFSNTVTINAVSANGTVGTAGQVLHSDGTKTYWATDDVGTGTVTSITAGAGLTGGTITTSNTMTVDAAYQFTWSNTHTFSNTVFVNAVSANGALGTAGQTLHSDGTKTYWAADDGSNWTITGSDIYRNSKVAIGSTTAPTVALAVTGDTSISANLVVDTSTLVVDATNNRVGIGVASPLSAIDVSGSASHNIVALGGSGTQTMTLTTGQIFTCSPTAAVTFAFAGAPATRSTTVVLHLAGSAQSITWPNNTILKWPSGTAPTLSASGTDVIVFHTVDGGTTWRGNVFGKAF